MSSSEFDDIIDRFPSEADSIRRLVGLVAQHPGGEFTFEHLLAEVSPSSEGVLALVLAEVASAGVLQRFLRVESESRGGIADFESTADIPMLIDDWRLDREVEVTPEMIRVVYKVAAGDHGG